MTFRKLLTALWIVSSGPFVPAHAAEIAVPTAVVERFHAALIDNMKMGKALNFDGRRIKLEPLVKATFDMPFMARISTGAAWQKMTEAEHIDITAALTAWMTADYAGNFRAWEGESFVTKDQTPDDGKGNVLVNTSLIPKGAPPVLFNYRLHQVDGAWRVFDIYLDGAVSQLALRRSEFAAVLARGSAVELTAHMNKLATDARKGD